MSPITRALVCVLLVAVCGRAAALDDRGAADDGRTAERFEAGTEVTEVTVVDDGVRVRKIGEGDAFVRWGGADAAPLPLNADHNAVAFTIAALPDHGRVSARLVLLGADGKYLATPEWLPATRKPGRYLLPDIAAFIGERGIEGAARWQLFLRVATGPPGAFVVSVVEVGGELEPSQPTAATLDDLDAVARTAEPIPVIFEGGSTELAFRVANGGQTPLTLEAAVTAIDYDGRPAFTQRGTMTIEPAGVHELPLPGDELTRGFYYLQYTLTHAGQTRTGLTSVAVLPEPARPPIGVGRHYHVATGIEIHAGDLFPQMAALLDAAGLRGVRFHHKWEAAEPRPGEWNFTTMDRAVERLTGHGIEIQHILAYNTHWALTPEERSKAGTAWRFVPPDPALFGEYVRRMVERYRGGIRHWEVWNEPDLTNFWLGDTRQYVELLRTSNDIIKSIDPNARVMTGGFATLTPHGGRKHPDLQRDVLADAYESFDIHAFHQHGPAELFAEVLEGPLRDVRAALAEPRPLWFNETAMTTGRLPRVEGERMQAEAAMKKLSLAFAHGAIGFTWYNHREDGRTWGMVSRDFGPKPVLAAFNAWVREVGDLPFAGRLDVGRNNHAHVWGDADRRVITAWSLTADATRSVEVVHVGEDASVTAIDVIGREAPVAVEAGRFLLPVGAAPRYARIGGSTQPPSLGRPLLSVRGPVAIDDPARSEIPIELVNPFDRPVRVELAPAGGEPVTVNLAANERRETRVPIPIHADADRRFGDRIDGVLHYRVDGRWSGSLDLPLVAGALIPAGPPDERSPDFSLNDRDAGEIVSRFDYAPAYADLVWQGPHDLSADVWLARVQGDESIAVVLDVLDDTHVQTFSGEAIWRGDSVQVALGSTSGGEFAEFGIAEGPDGRALVHQWRGEAIADLHDALQPGVARVGGRTRYTLRLPLRSANLTADDLHTGLRVNVVVNDNDGEAREGWAQLAPGLAEAKDARRFPVVRFLP